MAGMGVSVGEELTVDVLENIGYLCKKERTKKGDATPISRRA